MNEWFVAFGLQVITTWDNEKLRYIFQVSSVIPNTETGMWKGNVFQAVNSWIAYNQEFVNKFCKEHPEIELT